MVVPVDPWGSIGGSPCSARFTQGSQGIPRGAGVVCGNPGGFHGGQEYWAARCKGPRSRDAQCSSGVRAARLGPLKYNLEFECVRDGMRAAKQRLDYFNRDRLACPKMRARFGNGQRIQHIQCQWWPHYKKSVPSISICLSRQVQVLCWRAACLTFAIFASASSLLVSTCLVGVSCLRNDTYRFQSQT